jgi:hypothetical protein
LWLAVAALLTVGCRSPQDAVRPVIHTNDDRIVAMKAAPIVIVAEMGRAKLLPGKPRAVEKPPGIGGPDAPEVLLDLAEISAKVRLTLRGPEMNGFVFYTWVYHFGKHGGPRLFHPNLGSIHVMFLKRESGYLHTVGDYPNYDIEIASQLFPSFLAVWRTGYGQEADLVDHITAVLLKADLEEFPHVYADQRIRDLVELTGPTWFASQLDRLCQDLGNPAGRAEACRVLAEEYGR